MRELPDMNDKDAVFHFLQRFHYEAKLQIMYKELGTLEEAYKHAEYFEMFRQPLEYPISACTYLFPAIATCRSIFHGLIVSYGPGCDSTDHHGHCERYFATHRKKS
jgi:hypothetical protein